MGRGGGGDCLMGTEFQVLQDEKVLECILHIKVVKRVNPKSAHHKEKVFFSISLILYLCEMMDVH